MQGAGNRNRGSASARSSLAASRTSLSKLETPPETASNHCVFIITVTIIEVISMLILSLGSHAGCCDKSRTVRHNSRLIHEADQPALGY